MVSLSEQQQRTLGFLKPDVTDQKSELMALIKSNDLWKVTFEQEIILSLGEAKALYPHGEDATWLSSHPIYVFILEGVNVVKNWKEYVGPEDPEKAKQLFPQSLRATFGLDSIHNVCHASESNKQAHRDLTWLQGLVVDDLSIPPPPSPDVDDNKDTTSASSSEQSSNSVKSSTATKLSKLKKPTASRISKATPSKPTTGNHLKTTSSNNSSSSYSSSSEAKKKNPTTDTTATTKQPSNALPRPKSTLGTRPATPNSAKNTAPKSRTSTTKQPTTTGTTQKIPATTGVKKSIPTAASAKSVTPVKSIKAPGSSSGATRSGPLRTSKAQASNSRKDIKPSRISSRSELSNKSSPDSAATMGPSTSKRLSNTGGISKNTPGISVLTGRTRKYSRLEKRKDTNPTTAITTTTSATTPPIAIIDENPCTQRIESSNDSNAPVSGNPTSAPNTNDGDHAENRAVCIVEEKENEEESVMTAATVTAPIDEITPENNGSNNTHVPYATESVNTLTSASTSYSQRTMDSDHDAEVAAATSAASVLPPSSTMKSETSAAATTTKTNNNNNNHTGPRIDSPVDLMDRRRSSSFSPASVASSLARPETPEVDNLRQRFETLATNNNNTIKATTGTTTTSPTRRTSSITPEMALRIKELKPKDPAGSRVKSMVEFFMDENIHKWEF